MMCLAKRMELIRGIHNLKPRHKGTVLTIGNFDGVHLGHQSVLTQLAQKARALQLPATVMTFEPQPLELFGGGEAPARLSRLRDKYVQLRQHQIDRLLCVNFHTRFARMEAEEFVHRLLVEQLGVKFLVVGDDFHFGHRRRGNFAMLCDAGRQHGFEVVSMNSFCLSHHRVSSTRVRQALLDDELAIAANLLGRPYSISGRVSHGDKKGRTIGFPTANVPLKRQVSPVWGVYVVDVNLAGGVVYQGVANIGHRPTVAGMRQQLEVHLFDFAGDLYGQQIEVVLRHKLRNEQKFPSFDALRQQIEKDVTAAQVYLGLSA